jgi:hypothetical protein
LVRRQDLRAGRVEFVQPIEQALAEAVAIGEQLAAADVDEIDVGVFAAGGWIDEQVHQCA